MLHLKWLQIIVWSVRTYSSNSYLSKSILNKKTDMWPIISHPHVITLLRFHTHVIWPFFMACHAFLNIPIWLKPHCRKCQSHLYSSLWQFILQIFHWKSTANSLAICMFNTPFSVPCQLFLQGDTKKVTLPLLLLLHSGNNQRVGLLFLHRNAVKCWLSSCDLITGCCEHISQWENCRIKKECGRKIAAVLVAFRTL